MSRIPEAGDLIGGRYRVIRQIGEGGMGTVFEGENLLIGRRFALKWMHPSIASKPEASRRLIREAQAASRVCHPNVVEVYDVLHEGADIFLVLELLDGHPLSVDLESGGMPMHRLVGILLQAMRGVAAAHAQGVIHRDIHPGNIFVRDPSLHGGASVKVLDFGISKLSGEAGLALTQSGTTMGRPMYMSYEQLCAVRDIDVRTDVYSFGVILYEAITGRYPYSSASLTELAVKMATTGVIPARTLRPEIPSVLERHVMAAIARDRDARMPSMQALIEALKPFAYESGYREHAFSLGREVPRVLSHVPSKDLVETTDTSCQDSDGNLNTPLQQTTPMGGVSTRPRLRRWPALGLLALLATGAGAWLLTAPSEQSAPTVPGLPLGPGEVRIMRSVTPERPRDATPSRELAPQRVERSERPASAPSVAALGSTEATERAEPKAAGEPRADERVEPLPSAEPSLDTQSTARPRPRPAAADPAGSAGAGSDKAPGAGGYYRSGRPLTADDFR